MPVLEAFSYPKFRRVWAAGFVSQLGDWMQITGRAVLALRLTGRAESVGVVYFATYAPQLFFSLWGGVLADRFDRRRLLMATQVVQAGGAAVLGALVLSGSANLLNISVLSFVMGVGFMLAVPTAQALAPAVVPRAALTSAISLGTATNSITRVIGPLLAAFAIGAWGLKWVFWINAVSFFAVIVAWALTTIPAQAPMQERNTREALGNAIRYVRRTPSVAVPIGVSAFLMLFGVVYQPLAVVYATKVLAHGHRSLGDDYYGWLQAGIGAGAAVGILASAAMGRRHPAATLVSTALAFSIALAVLGQVDSFAFALPLVAVVGGFHFANLTLAVTLVQHEVPDALRGRVMSIHMLGLVGVVPITALGGAWIADRTSLGATFTGAGLICLAFSVVAMRWMRFVRLRDGERELSEPMAAVGVLLEEEA